MRKDLKVSQRREIGFWPPGYCYVVPWPGSSIYPLTSVETAGEEVELLRTGDSFLRWALVVSTFFFFSNALPVSNHSTVSINLPPV